MSLIATESHVYGNLVKQEYGADMGYCKEVVTVNDTAGTLAIGTVLGKITASGKYVRAVETAVDGSKVAAGLVAAVTTIAGATDTNVLIIKRGPISVSKGGLVLSSTYDNDAKKNAVYASLEAVGIQVLTTI